LNDIKNLLFDLDGTLVDSADGIVEAVNYSMRAIGEPEQPAETIKPYIGFPLSELYGDLTDRPYSEMYKLFRERADAILPSTTQPLPGAGETLDVLREAGYNLNIVSTKTRKHICEIVDALDWSSLIGIMVGGDDVSQVKPAPEAFNLALEMIPGTPTDSIAIGDTINDVIAAKAVPMPVVGVVSPYGGRTQLEESGPDVLIESIDQLPDLLHRLRTKGKVS
jgi:phosphoglycolate phosphatase